MTNAPRLPDLRDDEMNAEQLAAKSDLLAGPRRSLGGPFHAWLRSPRAATRLGKLGEYLRYETTVPLRLAEFAILIVARQWTSQFEWWAHYPMAVKAGLRPEIAAAVADGRRPDAMSSDETAVYEFCMQLRYLKRVDDRAYEDLARCIGVEGIIDLIALCGLYDTVAMTLAAARVPLPDGEAAPLSEGTRPVGP